MSDTPFYVTSFAWCDDALTFLPDLECKSYAQHCCNSNSSASGQELESCLKDLDGRMTTRKQPELGKENAVRKTRISVSESFRSTVRWAGCTVDA
jgi:hypothetical protein